MEREIKVIPITDFSKQPGSFLLRKKILKVLAKAETNSPQDLLEVQELIEEILRRFCKIENGSWEEVLENISAEEAEQLLQQIIGGAPAETNFTPPMESTQN